jgi:exonuclease VII large subunit
MRLLLAPIVIGTLTIAGAFTATAEAKLASTPFGAVQIAALDSTTDRESFTQKARDQMKIWEQKLQDFDAKLQAKSTDAKAKASKNLDSAWAATKAASARLESAGEKDWGNAKSSFNKATAKLASAWHKVNPAEK